MSKNWNSNDIVELLDAVPQALRTVRILRDKSLRTAALESGTSVSTLVRIERGDDCNVSSLRAVLVWIGGTS